MAITEQSAAALAPRSSTGGEVLGRSRPRAWARTIIPPFVVAVVLIIGWSLYARQAAGGVFPTPWETAQGFWTALTSAEDWRRTLISWRSLAIGYVIAVPIGVTLGFLLGASRTADRLLGVYLDMALVVPMIVMMPIVLIAIGITTTAEVVVIIFFAVPYVTLPIRNGIRSIPPLWIDLSKSLCASRWQTWRLVMVPGARSALIEGLRLGLAHALSGLFTVELTLAALGLGTVVWSASEEFRIGDLLGYLLFVLLQVVLVMSLMRRLNRQKGSR